MRTKPPAYCASISRSHVARHAGDKFGCKPLAQVGGDLQCAQSLARERDLKRGLGRWIGLDGARYRRPRQPGAASGRILDAQQEKTGFRQVLVPEPHQALDVIQFHGPALARADAHSSRNQA